MTRPGVTEPLRDSVPPDWSARDARLVASCEPALADARTDADAARRADRLCWRRLSLPLDSDLDYQGRPIGTDFSNVYAAGTYVLEGRPEAPFDAATQHAREKQIFGAATPFYGWHYPPFFLFIAAAAGAAALSARARGLAGRDAGCFISGRSARSLPLCITASGPAAKSRIASGSCSPSPSRPSSSISVTAITASSPPR